MEQLDVCSIEYPAQILLVKNMKKRAGLRNCMGEAEEQGLSGWKGISDRGGSLTKTRLVGAIKQSESKLYSRRPGTGWVGAS